MSGVRKIAVGADEAGLRLDRWFKAHFPELGHGRLEKLLRKGQVRVDGRRAKSNARLEPGQTIRVPPFEVGAGAPAPRPAPQRPVSASDQESLQAAVLYQDDWLIALDKPAGLAVQGGTGQSRHLDGMLDALRFGRGEAPRLVHRLDKDTSGVLILARSAKAARALTASFRDKNVRKTYWAAVAGVPHARRGIIDTPLAKQGAAGSERMAPDETDGEAALTLYHLAARRKNALAWLVLQPVTGRTHQLRAHCAAIGHPILGDGKFGGRKAFLESPGGGSRQSPKRLQLHAREIALPHPEDGTTLRVAAPLPEDMRETWQAFGFKEADGETAAADLADWAAGLPVLQR